MSQTVSDIDCQDLSSFDIQKLNREAVPKHIAIIMDGNRRWAISHNLPISMGYVAGAEALTKVVKAASKLGVKVVTAYTFSTENWNRSQDEIDLLMELFQTYLIKERLPMKADGVRFNTIGDLSCLPKDLQREIASTKEFTSDCDSIDLVLALNYGSRNEICRAIKKIAGDVASHKISEDDITESIVSQHLDTHGYSDPDLLIRTSGEMRLSNFLLWQICYSEVYVVKTCWPDFTSQDLFSALLEYQKRTRRHGGA